MTTTANTTRTEARQALLAEVQAYAQANYDKGWDVVIETYTDAQLDEAIGRARTLKGALKALEVVVDVHADGMANAAIEGATTPEELAAAEQAAPTEAPEPTVTPSAGTAQGKLTTTRLRKGVRVLVDAERLVPATTKTGARQVPVLEVAKRIDGRGYEVVTPLGVIGTGNGTQTWVLAGPSTMAEFDTLAAVPAHMRTDEQNRRVHKLGNLWENTQAGRDALGTFVQEAAAEAPAEQATAQAAGWPAPGTVKLAYATFKGHGRADRLVYGPQGETGAQVNVTAEASPQGITLRAVDDNQIVASFGVAHKFWATPATASKPAGKAAGKAAQRPAGPATGLGAGVARKAGPWTRGQDVGDGYVVRWPHASYALCRKGDGKGASWRVLVADGHVFDGALTGAGAQDYASTYVAKHGLARAGRKAAAGE